MKNKAIALGLVAAVMGVSVTGFADESSSSSSGNIRLLSPPVISDVVAAAGKINKNSGMVNYKGFWYYFVLPNSNNTCPTFAEAATKLPAGYLTFNPDASSGGYYGTHLDGTGQLDNSSAGTVAIYGTGTLDAHQYDRRGNPNPDQSTKVCFKYVNKKADNAKNLIEHTR